MPRLNFVCAECAVANELAHRLPLLLSDGGQSELRYPFAQPIDLQDLLLDRIVPVIKGAPACRNFTRENPCRFLSRWIAGKSFFENQIAESRLISGNNPA